MVKATAPRQALQPAERRSGRDRRQRDVAPPGGRERRRNIEPRKPEVTELDITDSQWDALHADVEPAAAQKSTNAS